MRRAGAVLTGLVFAALWVSPAYAMTSPVFHQPPSTSQPVNGGVPIKVESEPDSLPILGLGLEKVTIEVAVSGPGAPGSLGKREGSVFTATWNVNPDYNGTYDIKATATSSNSNAAPKTATISGVKVNNPPSTPTGVKVVLKDNVPNVSWAANPEKDITGYELYRSVDGGSYTKVYSGDATSTADTNAPHSKALTYKVTATRKSPLSSAGIDSTSGATSALTIPAPPEPAPGQAAADPDKPTVPGTNIVTGKEAPKPAVPLNKSFGKAIAPIVKSAPAGTAFEETLPYSGTPPEQFEAASGGDPSPIDTSGSEGVSVTNPIKFIVGGLLLAVASFFMWRKSRELLKGTRPQDQIAPTRVNFPTFRINRG
jgi:hypothetical protein